MTHYDALETRSADERAVAQLAALNRQIALVAAAPGACRIKAHPLADLAALATLPVLRKADLGRWQAGNPPFGGVPVANLAHV
ncbi:MAG: phenylacetate--CoA ligase family protein, partial [Paracoccaceae bacterium]|nr:phenylacetate--CoA ligase family protein [Paracoccaceae bacterium]